MSSTKSRVLSKDRVFECATTTPNRTTGVKCRHDARAPAVSLPGARVLRIVEDVTVVTKPGVDYLRRSAARARSAIFIGS